MKRSPPDKLIGKQRSECCAAWSKAHQSGTDNEGYASLISDYGDGPHTGDGLPVIKFCPWCGAPKGVTT